MRTALPLSLALLVSLAVAPPAAARGKAHPTTPGKYTDWNGEIDELEIVSAFKSSDYVKIVVEPFDTSATPLPGKDDNTYEPVQRVLARAAPPFAAGLARDLPRLPVSLAEDKAAVAEPQALVIRVRVTTMDPGSRAARYWGGFGAGAARTQIVGDVLDAATGNVLLRFTQERRSAWGLAGGGYEDLLERNLVQIGGDVAGILKFF